MADRLDIADALESLAVHCRPPLMSVEDRSRWMVDWCSDLANFPIEAIKLACTRWRQGENTRFPTPGQLLPMVRAVLPAKGDGPKVERWRPISGEDYRQLPIRDKIRHLQIELSELMTDAGPMMINEGEFRGRRLTPDEMPAKWHDAQARAAMIDAEIKRLRDTIRNAREKAV
ncbi:hypothetical protein JKL49_11240 [Phenylobacterium sp. 20VBR1]|uniref:Uncharacterized protein n=1 Tax=Phenylobacterium glaciei TaxID=2803784 RepID=A0A941D218_9CAUL|nr:hypothetical protein [Phenylobacterium glaciei]MBR7619964.1 hypothetical protein [Phenylobacterium glaciei]